MSFFKKTIAAVATPKGSGGVSVIRISGDDAVNICDRVLKGKKPLEKCTPYLLNYGRVIDEEGKTVDRVLYVLMRAPHSFTGEDVVEIHAHGGILNTEKILSLVIAAGASLAGRGEFTKRAFLNGKMDLAQAEAVLDIINSKTENSLYGAVNQLEGKLSGEINSIRDLLISLAAQVSVSADYPEEDIDYAGKQKILAVINDINERISALIKTANRGRILREGVCCAIVGRPNTGKSSLLNALCGEGRAIVTDIAGTTRDIIEEYVNIDGVAVRLGDTAGIRDGAEVVEEIGINMAREYIKNADICILVVDGSNISGEDEKILDEIKDKKHIIAVNKSDIKSSDFHGGIKISAKTGEGLGALSKEIIKKTVGEEITHTEEKMITNARHIEAARRGAAALKCAVDTIEGGFPPDLVLSDIEEAIAAFGEITGKSVSDEIIDKVFSEFCLGK